jgi:hypothetical protein
MKSQLKFDRYARYAASCGAYYRNRILNLCFDHFPAGLRQWASDQILLRVVALEYGVAA